MILVAGLAIAGLAGIAAAFYFSVRPGNSNSRGRTAGSGRTGTDRTDRADRTGRTDRTDRADRTDRTDRFSARGSTLAPPSASSSRSGPPTGRSRPDPDDDYEAPSRRHAGAGHLAPGHRIQRDETAGHTVPVGLRAAGASASAGSGSRPRPAERAGRDADETADANRSTRGRRRVGFRKGAEVDEELWPTEAFGGVSDEQFWDDMASDKPLATTARSADPGSRRRLPDVAPLPNGRDADGRGRHDGSRMAGSGSYAPPAGRPGPADRSDRTGGQPIQTSPQRIQTGPHSIPTGPQVIPTGPQPLQVGTQPVPVATRSSQPKHYPGSPQSYQPATQPAPVMGQGMRGGMPPEPRGRGRGRHANTADAGASAGAGEDPLTSAAYALRPPGAVDGRSQSPRRSRDLTREQYEATIAQDTQSFSLSDTKAATGGYPGGVPPFRQYELPASGGPTSPNGLNGNGNGRAPEYRTDGGRSDTGRYDQFRADPYGSGGRPDPLRTADAYGGTSGHPYPERPYGDLGQSASTPQYGETYGYGYPVSPVDDPRQSNGTRGNLGNVGNLGNLGQGRSGVNGGGTGARPVYPAGNGYRGSYDPRANGRG